MILLLEIKNLKKSILIKVVRNKLIDKSKYIVFTSYIGGTISKSAAIVDIAFEVYLIYSLKSKTLLKSNVLGLYSIDISF